MCRRRQAGEVWAMMTISTAARGLVRRAGLAAVVALVVTATSHEHAEALSLASPTALPSAKYASEGMTIEVRGGHGGGGGFRGGGGFHGGGFRAAHIYRGGYHRFGGDRVPRCPYHRRSFTGGTSSIADTSSIGATTRRITPIRAAITAIAYVGWSGPITVRADAAGPGAAITTGATAGDAARPETNQAPEGAPVF